VISNLVNRGTVLLNYRLGDLGRLTTEACACGRTARVLARLDGRVHELIRLSGGTIIVPSPVEGVITRPEEVRAYQLIQLEPERFELRLVTAGGDFERLRATVGSELSSLLAGARVDVVRVAEIDRGGMGKYRRIVPVGR
jgi:phenylacetate-CoA ligase